MAKTKKQLAIAGTERTANKKVEAAAEAYVEVRDERMALTKKEVEARDKLLAAMEEAKLTEYVDEAADPPLTVEVVEGAKKVKVRRETDDVDDDGWK